MITQYLNNAMKHARYEILEDDGSYYGEIPECRGVYANADTLEDCRDRLEEVLEDWILLRIHNHLAIPVIEGIELSVKKKMAA
uniref:Predicted nuclease of the RNAse H fold, HicB family n=1 Tax=Candidatus Kentrum sp. FW TaxID=2126338 RepID=A0A450TZL1_9GAMM|nr:MAG: Predicted nuclease of the RNAse H fold, HicB family [Candidatus Kentron sp. FW]VFJ75519.1 MAG: Predicted nuclease of the RNAse H fold, HicB family [Candidatus Kentron sp. FW]